MAKLCRHYGISCVSLRDAIYTEVMAAAPGYSMPEVAGDCVHPSKSTRGPAIMGDLVVHALQRLWDDARPLLRAPARPEAPPLPPPLHRVERRQSKDGGDGISWRCYQLRPRADIRALNERTQTLAFTPGAVLANGSFARAADVAERASKASCSRLARCATRQDAVCVRDLGGWRYCTHTIARHPARKEGVVAMWPGAAMQLTVDASAPGVEPAGGAPPRRCESGGGDDGDGAAAMPMAEARAATRCGRSVLVSLMYLTSYDGMGAARVTCVDGCECAPHLFDAFEASDRRNVSVVVERTFAVTPAAQCTLRFIVTNRTRAAATSSRSSTSRWAPAGRGGVGTCTCGARSHQRGRGTHGLVMESGCQSVGRSCRGRRGLASQPDHGLITTTCGRALCWTTSWRCKCFEIAPPRRLMSDDEGEPPGSKYASLGVDGVGIRPYWGGARHTYSR